MPKQAQPQPVVVTEVCSMCGLDWRQHGESPTTGDCIRLLRAELARRPVTVPFAVRPIPYVPCQRGPYWGDITVWSSNTGTPTPRPSTTICKAIGARS